MSNNRTIDGSSLTQPGPSEKDEGGPLRACLIVLSGENAGRIFALPEGVVHVMGRGGDCDIRLEDDGVSRRHATIIVRDGVAKVVDLGSRNGTFCNGKRVQERVLENGDRVRLAGTTVMRFSFTDALDEAVHKNLYDAATTDPLTGVHNRRFLNECLSREVASASRHQRALSLVLVDIDHFKKVNDTYGHAVGDKVLSEVADALLKTARREDVLARVGGEEFCVLLRDCAATEARVVAERMRLLVAALEFRDAETTFKVTASFGVAAVAAGEPTNADEIMKTADERLYAAKSNGRNRVES